MPFPPAMRSIVVVVVVLALLPLLAHAVWPVPAVSGNLSAAYALLERVIPGSSAHFDLTVVGTLPCGTLQVRARTLAFVFATGSPVGRDLTCC